MTDASPRRAEASQWFANLRDRLCAAFEAIEDEYVARTGQGTAVGSSASPGSATGMAAAA